MSAAQVLLRWGLQRTGGVIIPRSANLSHMQENLAVFDPAFELTPAEFASLSSFPQKKLFSVYCQPWC